MNGGHEGRPLDVLRGPLVGELLDRLSSYADTTRSRCRGSLLVLPIVDFVLGRPPLGNRYDLVGAALGDLAMT